MQEQKENKVKVKTKKKGSILKRLIVIVFFIALLVAGAYFLANKVNKISKEYNKQSIDQFASKIHTLETENQNLKKATESFSSGLERQQSSIDSLQKRIDTLNSQKAMPINEMYERVSLINISAAIDYLSMAKDLMIFTGNFDQAKLLVESAQNKLQSVNINSVSSSDLYAIIKELKSFSSYGSQQKQFDYLVKSIRSLSYMTPENISKNKKLSSIASYLKNVVEIQKIPDGQGIVLSKSSQEIIMQSIYYSLIQIQSSIYSANKTKLDDAKVELKKILDKYFEKDNDYKKSIISLDRINVRDSEVLTRHFDKVINVLSIQQSQMMKSAGKNNKLAYKTR